MGLIFKMLVYIQLLKMGVMEWEKSLFIKKKKKDFRMLPDKAFRLSYCIVKIEAEYQSKKYVFTEPLPNSVQTNKPLLESFFF